MFIVLAFGYAFYVLFSLPVTYFLLLQAEKSGCILLFQQTLVWRTLSCTYGDDKRSEGGDKLQQSRYCLVRAVNQKNRAKGNFWKEATAKFLERGVSI